MGDLAVSLAAALRDGTSVDELARELRDVLDDESRAEMIARTEVARAQSQASLDTYGRADVRRVEWLTSPGNVCMQCEANADQGPISTRQVFTGGVDSPPQHPNCRCALMPVLDVSFE
ncbi:phage minor head protein [Actinomadura harenae]|uniref:Phage head morphogenesis domain-containing protein n=1 Tax=Actinomadura harenae TaxID=2483351 RepID=A0A3M2MJP1_9ACTN|nr:phage minor head protein [Actinomadura harenae]RMI47598.1 hypothetical protein EBO15_01470 [Actinomadura harenae]